jgi:predicted  nucleic acid-binding Zn-ribbon protein
MFNEVKNSIKARLYDSTYTPFMSSYILSWIFINNLYVLIFFGDFKDKISLLKEYDFGLYNFNMWASPLAVALVYIYIYPFFLEKFYKHTLKKQKQRNDIKQEVEGKQLLSIEQSRAVRLKQSKLEDVIDKKDKKIEDFKNEILTLENEKSKIEENVFKKLSIKEEEIHKKAKDECEKSTQSFKIELDKSSKQLESKNNELEEYKIINQNLKNEYEKQNKSILSLKNNIEKLTNEIESIKQNNKDMKNIKYKNFLKEFSNDEITILETIYTNSIGKNHLSILISSINQYTKIPEVKIELGLKSIADKGYMELLKYDQA